MYIWKLFFTICSKRSTASVDKTAIRISKLLCTYGNYFLQFVAKGQQLAQIKPPYELVNYYVHMEIIFTICSKRSTASVDKTAIRISKLSCTYGNYFLQFVAKSPQLAQINPPYELVNYYVHMEIIFKICSNSQKLVQIKYAYI